MPTYSIICGILLSLIGIIGGIIAYSDNPEKWKTALIPLAFGVVLIIFGALAQSQENLRKHLMHAALLVALFGIVAILFSPAMRNVISTGQVTNWTSFTAQISMAFVCLSFIIAGVKSFAAARKN